MLCLVARTREKNIYFIFSSGNQTYNLRVYNCTLVPRRQDGLGLDCLDLTILINTLKKPYIFIGILYKSRYVLDEKQNIRIVQRAQSGVWESLPILLAAAPARKSIMLLRTSLRPETWDYKK